MKHAVGSIALAALLLAGCSAHGSSASPVVPSPVQPNVTNVGVADDGVVPDTATTAKVGIRLNGETPFMSPRYGQVLGYFKGKVSTTSQVVSLFADTPVRFFNVDASFPHTASFLGDATRNSAPWPQSFNGSSTASPAGTPIGTTNWSTGSLLPGGRSKLYNTGMPGFYMIGCAFHYNTHGMRTVVIVK